MIWLLSSQGNDTKIDWLSYIACLAYIVNQINLANNILKSN
jgi:hypothetical protein